MEIIWSNRAQASYEKTIDFIIEKWTPEIAENFESLTNKLLDRINKSYIGLVAFIDNRSNHKY